MEGAVLGDVSPTAIPLITRAPPRAPSHSLQCRSRIRGFQCGLCRAFLPRSRCDTEAVAVNLIC